MKAVELREKSLAELKETLEGLYKEQFNLKLKHSIGQLDNPRLIRQVRRQIARVKTIMNEKRAK